MKPCRHGHSLSDRYRDKKGFLRCRGCDHCNSNAWKAKEMTRRRRFWEAWLALGELQNAPTTD